MLKAFLWMIGLPFFFLFIPLISFLTGPGEIRRCPVCGWETAGSERFCFNDTKPLKDSGNDEKRRDE